MATARPVVGLLDYGAGNVRSIRNAINRLGYDIEDVDDPSKVDACKVLVFPGVGAFGSAMDFLTTHGYVEPLRRYIASGRPFFGVCIGLQCLFEGSDETPGVTGLGVIPGTVGRFSSTDLSVPHIGWNGVRPVGAGSPLLPAAGDKVFFVHSYRAAVTDANRDWVVGVTDYGSPFITLVEKGLVSASQCHPEKSGAVGLAMLGRFFERSFAAATAGTPAIPIADIVPPADAATDVAVPPVAQTKLARRVVACLDVRSNDAGDLVVTKGDQYDVRTADTERGVRNLGKPVELAARYYAEGADEVTFLNITAFRDSPLEDQPMLAVLEAASKQTFVPLTVGGGIRAYTDAAGKAWSALEVAARYFRAGADKVSIGSDAVVAAEEYYARGRTLTGDTSIEQIAAAYGSQAVVISVDPRRVYVADAAACEHHTVEALKPGPGGETHCWYQCTTKGGREGRPIDAVALAVACEALGAGELLVNCIDHDGQSSGFDLPLISSVCDAVSIPVIASSGAGSAAHFAEVFRATRVEAALAAGMFHRREVPISAVKDELRANGVEARAGV